MSTHLSSAMAVPRQDRVSAGILRAALIVRAFWNAAFAVSLLLRRQDSVKELILAFMRYAFVDALLAIVVATSYLAVSPRRPLWLSPAIDAATRLLLVALVVLGPGGLDVPVTAVLYFGILAAFVVVDGALDVAEGMSLDRELGHQSGWWSLSANGIVAIAAGTAMFALNPGVQVMRALLVVVATSHATASASSARHVTSLLDTSARHDEHSRA